MKRSQDMLGDMAVRKDTQFERYRNRVEELEKKLSTETTLKNTESSAKNGIIAMLNSYAAGNYFESSAAAVDWMKIFIMRKSTNYYDFPLKKHNIQIGTKINVMGKNGKNIKTDKNAKGLYAATSSMNKRGEIDSCTYEFESSVTHIYPISRGAGGHLTGGGGIRGNSILK